MSLWEVNDLATAVLMERFYDNLLTRPMPRDEALREAQAYTRDLTISALRAEWLSPEMIERVAAGNAKVTERLQHLAAQPDAYRPFSHPYFWGAFICQGDPSPLP